MLRIYFLITILLLGVAACKRHVPDNPYRYVPIPGVARASIREGSIDLGRASPLGSLLGLENMHMDILIFSINKQQVVRSERKPTNYFFLRPGPTEVIFRVRRAGVSSRGYIAFEAQPGEAYHFDGVYNGGDFKVSLLNKRGQVIKNKFFYHTRDGLNPVVEFELQ